MSKRNVTTGVKIRSLLLAGCTLLFMQSIVQASGGDNETCTDSGNSTQKKEAHIQAAKSHTEVNAIYFNSSILQELSDIELEIENWIADLSNTFWQESEINLENWMYNVHNNFWEEIQVIDSEEYALEDWMVNPKGWIENTSVTLENGR